MLDGRGRPSSMKVKLVYEGDGEREFIISMNSIPRIGEKVLMMEDDPAEVTAVTYTPWSEEHQAIVHVLKCKK